VINKLEQGAVILLSIVVGFSFAMHGYPKIANGPDHFVSNE